MTKLTLSNTLVRVAKANYPLITERLREAIPELKLTHDPIEQACDFRGFVGYYPPEDEDR